jgi:hypothetical protein
MGVDVEQARRDDLASDVERLCCAARNIGLDSRDAATGNRHVSSGVEPQ